MNNNNHKPVKVIYTNPDGSTTIRSLSPIADVVQNFVSSLRKPAVIYQGNEQIGSVDRMPEIFDDRRRKWNWGFWKGDLI